MKDRRSEIDPDYDLVVTWANEYADDKRNGWPGMPLSTMPLLCKPGLDNAIRDGKVKIVKVPSETRPGKTTSYIAPVR